MLTHPYQLTLDAGEQPTRFKFRIEDWWRSEDGQQSFYAAPGTLKRSCGNWVGLNPVEALVQPGATLNAHLTITVPNEITAGGYWCVLTVEEVPDPLAAPAGVGTQFIASVSTGVFIYVDPVERGGLPRCPDCQRRGPRQSAELRNAPFGVGHRNNR